MRQQAKMDELQKRLESDAEEVQRLPGKPGNETLLRLYALYKQAMQGDSRGPRPGFTDPVGRAKHDAWKKLAGVSREQAMAACRARAG